VDYPNYDDFKNAGYKTVGCGNYWSAYVYFFSYMVVLTLLSLNLFIAVILNGYFETLDQHAQFLNPDMLGIYRDSWSKYDPDANGFMSSSNFKKLLFDIGPPLGWGKDERLKPERQERYIKLASYLLMQ